MRDVVTRILTEDERAFLYDVGVFLIELADTYGRGALRGEEPRLRRDASVLKSLGRDAS